MAVPILPADVSKRGSESNEKPQFGNKGKFENKSEIGLSSDLSEEV